MTRRFPFNPLIPLIEAAYEPTSTDQQIGIVGKTVAVLKVDRQQVYRWLDYGLRIDDADESALELGLHPALIWPDEWASFENDDELDLDDLLSGVHRHGTWGAVKKHQRAGEPFCDVCKEFRRRAVREWKHRTGRQRPIEHLPCGTWAAAIRHRRRGERPCDACLQAERERNRELRRQRRANAA